MPRINIEDSIFKDNRYIELCIAAGSRITAIGALAWLFIEAQKHYIEHGEIPLEAWENARLPDYLITTGWAVRSETGVRARGQEEQFAWLRQRVEAGRKGGLSKSQAVAKRSLADAKQNVPSSSFSFSEEKEGIMSSAVADDSKKADQGGRESGPTTRDLMELWNSLAHERLPRVKLEDLEPGGKRDRAAKARLKKHPDSQFWIDLINSINESKFCLGLVKAEPGKKVWRAHFDWILQVDVPAKIKEGKYNK